MVFFTVGVKFACSNSYGIIHLLYWVRSRGGENQCGPESTLKAWTATANFSSRNFEVWILTFQTNSCFIFQLIHVQCFVALDKESRQYDVFVNSENDVLNIMSSLKAVSELQNPAVKDRFVFCCSSFEVLDRPRAVLLFFGRHWSALMATCGVRFAMNENTKLGDLFSLQLHKFEDEVKSIVDRAAKEQGQYWKMAERNFFAPCWSLSGLFASVWALGMEKTLRELNTTWADLQFDLEIHQRTGTGLIHRSEELVETLEENQVKHFLNSLQRGASRGWIRGLFGEI